MARRTCCCVSLTSLTALVIVALLLPLGIGRTAGRAAVREAAPRMDCIEEDITMQRRGGGLRVQTVFPRLKKVTNE